MRNALVRKLERYASLTSGDVALLTQATRTSRKVPSNRDLIEDGGQPSPAFVVLDGWACRYKMLLDGGRQITAFLMPGDFCDLHPHLLDRMDHGVGTIVACDIAAISRGRMETLVTASPTLAQAFWRAQLVDESVLRAWIVSMGRRGSLERTAHLMIELYLRMRNVGLTIDFTCKMPLTQTVLADALGLTPIHLNRVLQALRKRKVMHLESGTLTITNTAELMSISGFDCDYLHQEINEEAALGLERSTGTLGSANVVQAL